MPEWLKVVVLGILEGLTEFLPVSSTAHLLLAADLLRFGDGIGGTFAIVIQLGAILAVLACHAAELRDRARAFPRDGAARRFWLCLGLAFLLRAWIKAVLFASPAVIAWAPIAGGIALIAVERLPRRAAAGSDLRDISPRQALVIGIAQALALIPGVSRSGASIVGGMLAGRDRTTATACSSSSRSPPSGWRRPAPSPRRAASSPPSGSVTSSWRPGPTVSPPTPGIRIVRDAIS